MIWTGVGKVGENKLGNGDTVKGNYAEIGVKSASASMALETISRHVAVIMSATQRPVRMPYHLQ